MKVSLLRVSALVLLVSGLILLAINIGGLMLAIEPRSYDPQDLRFPHSPVYDYPGVIEALEKKSSETQQDFIQRLPQVIARRMAHIKWDKVESAEKYHQLIPVWENFILYFMGKVIKNDEYQRYHFADYRRSLKRSIGICGDASMIASQILDRYGIKNQIVSFPRHVVVEVDSGLSPLIIDADFGVVLDDVDAEDLKNNHVVAQTYLQAGYTEKDINSLNEIYQDPYQRWNGVKHFITLKYYFEIISYYLKWLLPSGLVLLGGWLFRRSRTDH